MSKTILVTGGLGFIGSNLVERLFGLGHSILVIDDLSSGKIFNLSERILDNIHFYKDSICNVNKLDEIFSKYRPEIVYHIAAKPRVQFSIKYPQLTNDSNINGTLNVLVAAQKYGVKRVVYSASSSAYGDQPTMPLVETMNPNPMSPYALQKYVGECYCNLYYKIHGLETISLRYFNVYGPKQDPEGAYACAIAKFILQSKSADAFTIWGDGCQRRDFNYMSDVVDANLLAGFSDNKEILGKVFNIGSGRNTSVNELVDMIRKLSGRNIPSIHSPPVFEPKETLADITLSKELLKWSPRTTFEQGLEMTYNYFCPEK